LFFPVTTITWLLLGNLLGYRTLTWRVLNEKNHVKCMKYME